MGKVLILLLILSQVKEEVFLAKILETKLEFGLKAICKHRTTNTDPLNVTKIADFYDRMQPEIIFNRFVFQTIEVYVERIVNVVRNEENNFIVKEFTLFLIYCLHIYQSGNINLSSIFLILVAARIYLIFLFEFRFLGSHCKTAVTAINLINNVMELKKYYIDLDKINANFIKISRYVPVLTFEWCYLLTLLNYNNTEFWASVMHMREDAFNKTDRFLNLDIIKTGAVIVYCDFLVLNFSLSIDFKLIT